MNLKLNRTARVLSLVLAASLTFGSTAMAAENVTAKTVTTPVINESDIPVEVGSLVTGIAKGVGTVEVLGVNVRENPNMNAPVVSMLGMGQQVVVLSKDGDWYRVSCEGVTGFVKCDYMSVAQEGEASLGYGLVKDGGANIRVAASEDSEAMFGIGADDVVTILGLTDGWYQVQVNDSVGYVRSDLIDPTAYIPAERIYDYAVIGCSAANLRSEPDADASKVDILYGNSLCTLLEQDGDWYKVQYGDTVGYVMASLMSATNDENDGSTEINTYNEEVAAQEAAAAAAAAAAAEKAAQEAAAAAAAAAQAAANAQPSYDYSEPEYSEPAYSEPEYSEPEYSEPEYSEPVYSGNSSIVSVAQSYLGVPYVWGGTSPSGFDCSGFTQYVFRQCGYSIYRTADMQYYNGSYVSYDNLSAGDLVFFCNTYAEAGITHVGIYIGGGQFIHAASGGVKISYLSESYYSSRYYGAVRVA